jgi:hypothetical protein
MTERDGFVQGGDALVRGKKKVYVLAVGVQELRRERFLET